MDSDGRVGKVKEFKMEKVDHDDGDGNRVYSGGGAEIMAGHLCSEVSPFGLVTWSPAV